MTIPPVPQNYYDILHVSRTAPQEIIRGSYRTLMQQLKHHPDLGGDARTAALINEAYAVLNDEAKRSQYDALLDHAGPEEIVAHAPGKGDGTDAAMTAPLPNLDPFRQCLFCTLPHNLGSAIDNDSICKRCDSPLLLAENRRLETVGQRGVARINQQQTITFYTQWAQSIGFRGQSEDISLSGLRFVSDEYLQQGQRIKLVSEVLEAVATVTHSSKRSSVWKNNCAAGVAFVTIRYKKPRGGFLSTHV